MNIINILEINKDLKDKRLHLPLEFESDDLINNFKEFILLYKDLFSKYLSYESNMKIEKITDTIVKCLVKYFNGQPKEAYLEFEDSLSIIIMDNYYFQNKLPINEVQNLYRIRTLKASELARFYTKEDIFHIPFRLRGNVSSSRYSISGYPCLYLATSIKVSIMETDPDFSTAICSRFSFESLNNLRVLNLSKKLNEFQIRENNEFNDIDNNNSSNVSNIKNKKKFEYYDFENYEFQDYLIIYPLIAACSIKVKNKTKKFKQEYIIPQLLLQWIRNQMNNINIIGIKYFTTRAKDPDILGYNYIFPTNYLFNYQRKNDEFCNILSSMVKFTAPILINNTKDIDSYEQKLSNYKTEYLI